MSAFYDIWISNKEVKPHYYRKGNAAWKEFGYPYNSVWESSPDVINNSVANNFETDTHRLIVIGQFYEKVDNEKLLQECTAYANKSNRQFLEPAGNYILFLLDKQSACVYVFTDRFGTYHAYYSTETGKQVISTYFIGLAKQSTEKKLDWEGVAGFLSMGYFPSDKTYFSNIKIFQPASCYKFDSALNLIEYSRYWNRTF